MLELCGTFAASSPLAWWRVVAGASAIPGLETTRQWLVRGVRP